MSITGTLGFFAGGVGNVVYGFVFVQGRRRTSPVISLS